MKKSKFYLLAGFFGLLITTLAVSSLASAQSDTGATKGPRYSTANHQAWQEAIEQGDYEVWKELVDSKPRITDVITEDNFDQFVQMHQLKQDGDIEGAKVIAEELGLPMQKKAFKKGFRMGHRMGNGDCPFADQE